MIGDNLYESAKENTMNSLIFMAIIILPCSVGLMVYSDQIIQLLFGGEAFDQQALKLTGQAMLWYATGLFMGVAGYHGESVICIWQYQDSNHKFSNRSRHQYYT